MMYRLEERTPLLEGDNFVAASATLIGAVTLRRDASIWFGTVLRGDNDELVVGQGSNVQDACVLHTDPGLPLVIGAHCTIGHQVMLHGCQIGDGSLIGIQSVILNRARIGRECLVGAKSLVTEGKSFPDGTLIMGSPAKVVRELSDEERAGLRLSAQGYVENARRFLAGLRPVSL